MFPPVRSTGARTKIIWKNEPVWPKKTLFCPFLARNRPLKVVWTTEDGAHARSTWNFSFATTFVSSRTPRSTEKKSYSRICDEKTPFFGILCVNTPDLSDFWAKNGPESCQYLPMGGREPCKPTTQTMQNRMPDQMRTMGTLIWITGHNFWPEQDRKKLKNFFLLQMTLLTPPDALGALKTQNLTPRARKRGQFGPFCDHFGRSWPQKPHLSQLFFFSSESIFFPFRTHLGWFKMVFMPLNEYNAPIFTHPRPYWDPGGPLDGLQKASKMAQNGPKWPIAAHRGLRDLANFRPPGAKKS